MNDEIKNTEMEEAIIRALTDFRQACYFKGCRDTIFGVAVGAGLALAGFVHLAVLHKQLSPMSKQELKKVNR